MRVYAQQQGLHGAQYCLCIVFTQNLTDDCWALPVGAPGKWTKHRQEMLPMPPSDAQRHRNVKYLLE